VAPDVKAEISRVDAGFSGADLANLVNEAALFARARTSAWWTWTISSAAKDKIIMGAERRSMVMPEEESKKPLITSRSRRGRQAHAQDRSGAQGQIIPRGRALGVTMQLPEQDRYSMDRDRLLSTITVPFRRTHRRGRFMGQMTPAFERFERATALARSGDQWGMSDAMGPMVTAERGEVFLGRSD